MTTIFWLFSFMAMLCGPAQLTEGAAASPQRSNAGVRVEIRAVSTELRLHLQGDYRQHSKAFKALQAYAQQHYSVMGNYFGEYPNDPDAVKTRDLRWQLGVAVATKAKQVPPGPKKVKTPALPYRLSHLEAFEAAVLESTIGDAGRDGLSMFEWMAANGYVQIGPTRMEYLDHSEAPSARTLIVVPVTKRKSGLRTPPKKDDRRSRLLDLARQVMEADYRGDREALRSQYDGLQPFVLDPELAIYSRYWRGFAMWRRAVNGFSQPIAKAELERDAEICIEEFQSGLKVAPEFVENKIGAAACMLLIRFLHPNEAAARDKYVLPAINLLREVEKAEPTNPRYLWVLGGSLWSRPASAGGGPDKAFGTYELGLRSLEDDRRKRTDPLLPSWGEPELHMSIAWSKLHQPEPDVAGARKSAEAALRVAPEWHYLKNVLIPQIEKASRR